MALAVRSTAFADARLLVPDVFADERGYFKEAYATARYEALGIRDVWVQDNVSRSARDVIRGLHGDRRGMAKLVQVLAGTVWDVIVDLRPGSPTYARWEGYELSAREHTQLYVPPGFLHGFLALEDGAIVTYKQSALYDPAQELAVRWDDPALGIAWPLRGSPVLSAKDAAAPFLSALAGAPS